MTKTVKYVVFLIVILVSGYNSVYFKRLSELKTSATGTFDVISFTKDFWDHELIPDVHQGVAMNELLQQLRKNPDKAFQDYSHALGIGNIKYFQVTGEGKVAAVDENYVALTDATDIANQQIQLVTEFVYGNAVRDATGKLDINKFPNTMQLNLISAEINRKIREEVIPSFKTSVKKGDKVQFTGAIELNQKYLDLENIEVIPTSLAIIQK